MTSTRGQSGLQPVWPPPTSAPSGRPKPGEPTTHDSTRPEEESFKIDFVALHGINGDLWNTWEHEDGTLWLRDLLPAAFPGARVWTYGYPANVFEGIQRGTLRNDARRLLGQLVTRTEVR